MPTTFSNKSVKIIWSLAFVLLLIIFSAAASYAQAICPVNIDFELGGFQNWECYSGTTTSSGNTNLINVSLTSPISGIHQVLKSSNAVDRYVPIKLSAPDGSDYIVKLGNEGTGARAERISYTFTVPNNQADFVLTYQYAVVLQDPGHPASQQPRFTAKVFDITANTYINCGSFEYVATANLPGFKTLSGIVYKDWTPASINLYGFQGHQLRLEFSTADCTQSGHFGYAYVDVNKTCSSLITGNNFCPEQPTFKLTGPAGFDKYNWYNADRSKLLGTGQVLELPTANNDNKTIVLDLIPFVGFGCNYTTSIVTKANAPVRLTVKDPPAVCFPSTVDINNASVISNKTAGLTYTFWKDAAATQALSKPDAIATSGTYYIKASSAAGCYVVSPVKVTIVPLPKLTIVNPPAVCVTSSVDLTMPAVTAGSSPALTFTYWTDLNGTKALQMPSQVKTAGTYYIKATNTNGCFVIKPVVVSFFNLPILKITDPAAVCFPSTVNIRSPQVTAGSDPGLTFTYWLDANCTQPLSSPDKVGNSGQYFIKATNGNGCETVKPVSTTVNALPELKITNPAAVCFPLTIDITNASVITNKNANISYTYWTDVAATQPINKPDAIGVSGTYYIKATSSAGCSVTSPVSVTINPLPIIKITNPPAVCLLSSVDITAASVTNGSATGLTFTYWIDAGATQPLQNPSNITLAGTYYIKGTNVNGCSTIKPVSVSFYALPILKVTNPAAVCFPSAVDITRPQVTAGSDPGLTFTYWLDANCTQPLSSPDKVGNSGQYFIKATNVNGCETVKPVNTTVNALPELKIANPASVCFPLTIDITNASVITNKNANISYTYWTDIAATQPINKPDAISVSGTYYIKATSSVGCSVTSPVSVTINPLPIIKITNPPAVCLLSSVDITAASVTNGSATGLTFTYWIDAGATQPLQNPSNITLAGTYYIKGTNVNGCSTIKPVSVSFYALPILKVTNPAAVCFPSAVDITRPQVTAGSDINLNFSYWLDAACTQILSSPGNVTTSGQYFIKAINQNGCETVKPVVVTINPLPELNINQPPAVCYPETIDLTHGNVTIGSTNVVKLTYWLDAAATRPLNRPNAVADSGLFYIKATSAFGCETVKPVLVTIHKLPVLTVTDPKKIYTPNTVDLTAASVTQGSIGVAKLTYWHDAAATNPVLTPKKVIQTGTYYIKGENVYGCFLVKPVEVVISNIPDIQVPKAFSPLQTQNNRLYPFLISVKSLISFKVYNRWGVLVFQTTDPSPSSGWDGVYKSQIQFLDVFTWYAEGIDYVGNIVRRSGNTVLLK